MIYNREQILEIIPHRDPFVLVDEIEELEDGKSATGIKHVTGDEYFFKGHFPGYPVMPGALIVEAMAQTGAVIILSMPEYKGKLAFFAGINDARFRKQVVPGDDLVMKVELEKMKMGIGVARGNAYVNGELACFAEIKFAVQR